MTIILIAILTSLLWTTFSFAREVYIVKRGDTLSVITRKAFPRRPIYGPEGKMKTLIRLNGIKNPDYLLPKQTLYLSEKEEAPTEAVEVKTTPQTVTTTPEELPMSLGDIPQATETETQPETHTEVPSDSSLVFSSTAHLGIKNLNLTQRKALGHGNVTGSYLDFKFNTEMMRKDLTYGVNFDTYLFELSSNGKNTSKRMNSLDIYAVYNSFVLGLTDEQLPLLRNNGGTLEMTRQSIYSAFLGYQKFIPFSGEKASGLRLLPWLSLPFANSVSKPGVNMSNMSGYGAHVRLDYVRELYKTSNFITNFSWSNQADFEQYSFDAKWGVTKGQSSSSITSLSSVLGVKLDY